MNLMWIKMYIDHNEIAQNEKRKKSNFSTQLNLLGLIVWSIAKISMKHACLRLSC